MPLHFKARLSLLLLLPSSAACYKDHPMAADSTGSGYLVAPMAVYAVTPLPMLPRTAEGEARGINDAGVIAGWVKNRDATRAVQWSGAAAVQDLGNLPGLPSDIANDINQAGTIVGFSFGSSLSFARAFVWERGLGMRALRDLGGNAGIAQAINSSGIVVGWAADSFGTVHAARWDAAGVLTDLNPPGGTSIAIDTTDAGDIIGWIFPLGAVQEHAHMWRADGAEIDLGTLGGPLSNGFGINNTRAAVGYADPHFPDENVAFIWEQARGMRPLGYGPRSQAFAISDPGRSVGLSISTGVTGLTTFRGVLQTLPDLAPGKPHVSGPTNVNRCGWIVGSSVDPNPASAALLPVVWTNGACD
ncbi:MAG: hypothetical protein ABI587_06930 [Gemmatimonadales bacterium]